MAVRFKLGYYSPVVDDPLQREHVGYFPRMTEEEAWTAGRGVWKANKERLAREDFALIIGDGRVCAVGEIHSVSVHEDRVAVDGEVLAEGHPVRDAWIGQPDPVVNASQNPSATATCPRRPSFANGPVDASAARSAPATSCPATTCAPSRTGYDGCSPDRHWSSFAGSTAWALITRSSATGQPHRVDGQLIPQGCLSGNSPGPGVPSSA
jgi:hypothetical protein